MTITTATVRLVRFRVFGVPKTQGSMRAIIARGTGRAIALHDQDPALRSWRTVVADAARQAHRGLMDGPLGVTLVFHLPVPTSRPETLRTPKQRWQWLFPWRRPDLDKLERAILDSLTGVLFRDDAQIVAVTKRKSYGAEPGVEVLVEPLVGLEGER